MSRPAVLRAAVLQSAIWGCCHINKCRGRELALMWAADARHYLVMATSLSSRGAESWPRWGRGSSSPGTLQLSLSKPSNQLAAVPCRGKCCLILIMHCAQDTIYRYRYIYYLELMMNMLGSSDHSPITAHSRSSVTAHSLLPPDIH